MLLTEDMKEVLYEQRVAFPEKVGVACLKRGPGLTFYGGSPEDGELYEFHIK